MAQQTDNLGCRVRTFARSLLDTKVAGETSAADEGMIAQFNNLRAEAERMNIRELPEPATKSDSFATIYAKSRLLAQVLPIDLPLPLVG
jgi:hypothetical protein